MALQFKTASNKSIKLLMLFSISYVHSAVTVQQQQQYGVEDRDLSGCSVELDSNIFNLLALARTKNDTTDYKLEYPVGNKTATIEFNICNYAFRQCPDGVQDFANFVNENNTCAHLSSSSLSDVVVNLQDKEDPQKGLTLNFYSAEQCNSTAKYNLNLQLDCDKQASVTTYLLDQNSIKDPCSKRVIITSYEACPKISLGTLWHFFNAYSQGFGVILVVVGFYFIMLGGRYPLHTMFLFGQFSFAAVLLVCLFAFIYPKNSAEWIVWISLILCLFIGGGAGYFTQKYARAGVLLIGAWLGGLFGAVLYASVVSKFASENTFLALWLTIIFTSLFVAWLSQVYFDHTVIVGSSIIGSYFFIRGLSIYIGGYPNEFILYQNYQNGSVAQASKTFFIYLIVMIVLAFSAIFTQFKLRQQNTAQYSYRKDNRKYEKF